MDLTSESIAKIIDISKPEMHVIKDVHGIETTHSTKQLFQIKAAPPEDPQKVDVLTLAGFSDLVKAKLEDKAFPADFVIHVEDEKTVALKARLSDEFGRRLVLIRAQPVAFRQFQFGNWMPQEDFAIALASLFADTEDKAYVLNVASTLTNYATMTSEDDGFTQKATAKAGIRMKEAITIKPRVDLAPFRTFPEIPQPVSQFVLRARAGVEGAPSLMLVEADGGRWKVDAIAELRKAMEAFGLEIPIIA